jgi:hypothetical protein
MNAILQTGFELDPPTLSPEGEVSKRTSHHQKGQQQSANIRDLRRERNLQFVIMQLRHLVPDHPDQLVEDDLWEPCRQSQLLPLRNTSQTA